MDQRVKEPKKTAAPKHERGTQHESKYARKKRLEREGERDPFEFKENRGPQAQTHGSFKPIRREVVLEPPADDADRLTGTLTKVGGEYAFVFSRGQTYYIPRRKLSEEQWALLRHGARVIFDVPRGQQCGTTSKRYASVSRILNVE